MVSKAVQSIQKGVLTDNIESREFITPLSVVLSGLSECLDWTSL